MDRSEVIKLISKTQTKNDLGIFETTEKETQIFCSVESIGASEFFNAGQNGLKPALKFTVNRYEYNGEDTLLFNGVRYSIYRTYTKKNEEIELYTQKDIGT